MENLNFVFVGLIGIIDVHCENCGAYKYVQSSGYHFCDRCGASLTSWAPLQSKSDERERLWLTTPKGILWKAKQDHSGLIVVNYLQHFSMLAIALDSDGQWHGNGYYAQVNAWHAIDGHEAFYLGPFESEETAIGAAESELLLRIISAYEKN